MNKIKIPKINELKNKNMKKKFNNLYNRNKEILINFYKDANSVIREKVSKISLSSNIFRNFQDKVENTINIKTEDVLLKQSTFWASGISWTIIGGTALGISWLALAKTEEIVITTGKLEPASGVVEIKAPIRGVTSAILVKEGQIVKKGETLIELDTEIANAQRDAYLKQLEISESILNRFSYLVSQGAVSELQFLKQQSEVARLRGQIVESEVTLKYQNIKSPITGYVFDLKPKVKGFVANSNEPIMKIVPTDKLNANIEIDSRTVGFVSVGKQADISIDSYPSSDFGVIKGEVKSISSDALEADPMTGKGTRFPAIISLKSQSLKLKNGNKLPLKVGMSLTANIKLRKVSYLKLLLNTFNDKATSLRSL